MGQPLVSRNRKPKKSGFLLCSIHSFFEGLKTASLASHRPLNKLLLSAKCFNNVRTAATKMADNERHFVSNFTNFQIKSSNKMNGKLATWQLVYKSGETSWWRCHWLIKFFFFFFHAGPLTGNAPLPDNQIHFANEFSKIFPLVFPLKEKRVGGGNRFFFRPLAARKRTKNSSTSNTNFTRSATRTNWFSLQLCF